jgi:hypothetical protein
MRFPTISAILTRWCLATLLSRTPGPALVAQRYRLWDSTGQPIVVVPFTFTVADGNAPRDSVAVTIRQWGALDVDRRDSSWSVPLARMGGSGVATMRGVMVGPSSSTLTHWLLIASVMTYAPIDSVGEEQTWMDDGGLTLSDLVPGADGSRLTWQHDSMATPLPDSVSFDHRTPVRLYYQALSVAAHAASRTTITVTNITNPKLGKRVLQIGFGGRLVRGRNDFSQDLDLTHQKRGRFRVELQVAALDGGGVSVRAVEFELR